MGPRLSPAAGRAERPVPPAVRHSVLEGSKALAGQSSPTPSQLSATSHTPAAARHWAVDFASAPQSAELPVHWSATSQAPTAARHWTADERNPLAGQLLPMPSQLSATSHTPSAARHWAVDLASAGQVAEAPVQ